MVVNETWLWGRFRGLLAGLASSRRDSMLRHAAHALVHAAAECFPTPCACASTGTARLMAMQIA